ncbi:unnamed protein product [Bursaphelenchus xylophilus]|uniref:(pine wood nematode) hypothetical protein n=1 Tax=Bursaphelenchus xylophilus TaxID=6326 RepID=A0A811KCF5_BURXY|nr:unnamed protein product [Bursaphelenchus xylophilus]CAG9093819.1 unnamed protein product [Bursaphelenchus xylophilus]
MAPHLDNEVSKRVVHVKKSNFNGFNTISVIMKDSRDVSYVLRVQGPQCDKLENVRVGTIATVENAKRSEKPSLTYFLNPLPDFKFDIIFDPKAKQPKSPQKNKPNFKIEFVPKKIKKEPVEEVEEEEETSNPKPCPSVQECQPEPSSAEPQNPRDMGLHDIKNEIIEEEEVY